MEKESNKIFRQKSIDRISSPEELNNYLRVTTPGIWMVLSAVVILLIGMIVWASVGKLETKAEAIVESKNGDLTVIVTGSRAEKIKEGMIVNVDVKAEDNDAVLNSVSIDEYGRAVGSAVLNIPDGKYRAEVVIESINPISFLIK